MDWFIGREKELACLEELYSSGEFSTCAIYGRRQIGKTTLMSKFASGKRAITFQFSKGTAYENLSHMGIVIGSFLDKEEQTFDSLSSAIESLSEICRDERTIVIFDELPYLANSVPDSLSIIQRFIDRIREDTSSMVLICGSSISMMRKETEEYDSPLYGRFRNRIELKPLSLKECKGFHPEMSDEDLLKTYLTVGGVPNYHRIMNENTYEGCIKKCFLGPNAPLSNEAAVIIEGELSPSGIHSGIVSCIADGKRFQNTIVDALGISKTLCSRYISNLEKVSMVEAVNAMLTAKKKPYVISDNLLAFHYTVLRKFEPILRNDDVDRTFRLIKPKIDTLLGKRYELLCRSYLTSAYSVKEIGSWWGSVDGEETDIDVVASIYNKDDFLITLLCECKFRREQTGLPVIHELEKKAEFARADDNRKYAVFSLGGFTEELKEYADDMGILLIGTEKLLGIRDPDAI